jgi:predicted nucleic acid-binding protein
VALSGERLLLVDKSALVGGATDATPAGELCLCAVTRLEMLFSARSSTDFDALQDELALFRDLRIDAETFAAAQSGQRDLARLGRHRVPIPDLLIAACAQQHGAAVVHVDRHFETLRDVFAFTSVRL